MASRTQKTTKAKRAIKKTVSLKTSSTRCHRICKKTVNKGGHTLPCGRGCRRAKGHASNYALSHKCYGGHTFS